MEIHNRRLPVYLLIDCSESMAGKPFRGLKEGIASMLVDLKCNPTALETVALSVITFSTSAKQVLPLTDIVKFQMPKLQIGAGTALGAALDLWVRAMGREVVQTSVDRKGDFKPIAFLLTDGKPTDSWEAIADSIRSGVAGRKANLIAVAYGDEAEPELLRRITGTVLTIKEGVPEALSQFFKWVSASVSTASQRLEAAPGAGIALPALPEASMEMAQPGASRNKAPGEESIYLHARCVQSRRFYLMRFRKSYGYRESQGDNKSRYEGVRAIPVEDGDLEEGMGDSALTVSTGQLLNSPVCPYCEQEGWGMCTQGHIHCTPLSNSPITLTCPWCGVTTKYELAVFDVRRGDG